MSEKPAPQSKQDLEFEGLVLSIAELLRETKTVEDRRNFVMRLQGQGMSAAQVEKVTLKAFAIKAADFQADLLWIQDYWDSYLETLGTQQARREVLAYNTELRRRAMDQGDLNAGQRANQHRAKLLRVDS